MHFKNDSKLAPAFKSLFLFIACLSLAALTVAGCSKPQKKPPEAEKKVVTDLNIPKADKSSAEKSAAPAVEEVESLPMDPAEEVEEMPELGSGN